MLTDVRQPHHDDDLRDQVLAAARFQAVKPTQTTSQKEMRDEQAEPEATGGQDD
jgi:hypothetical protein